MNRKKLLIRIISLILLIFVLNFLAMKFHWYFTIWYFDMLMHFLGGFWLGLAFFWFFGKTEIKINIIFKIMFFTLLSILFWEIFEISVDKIITKNSFNLIDTLSDLSFGLAGVLLAVFYLEKRIILKEKIQL